MSCRIYMDNHSTTRVDPRVVEAMLPYFTELYGNAASRTHAFGREAEEACEKARGQVATLIGARPREIVFTSGATESNNLALRGVLDLHRERGDHIVTVSTEHPSVLDPCRALEKTGRARVTYLGVGRDGLVDPGAVHSALTERTVLVSVMAANNEIGVLAPLREIASIVRERGIFLHTDATQAVGKIPVDVEAMGIDLMSFTAHKVYGPKGCGALYVRGREPRVRLAPLLYGGGHERGMRSGTLNVPGVVGFGRACEIAAAERTDEAERVRELRDRLRAGLERELDGVHLNGHPTHRLPGNLNLTFAHVEADSLMAALPELAVSSGSACASATLEPSHVLRAIGLSDDAAHQTIRFGLGRFTTAVEVEQVIAWVVEAVRRLRASSPAYRIARRGIGAGE